MTRLTPEAMLALAASTRWPQFAEGDSVRVHFETQDPIDGVVCAPTDRNGWVKVRARMVLEQDCGEYEFLALATATVRR